MTGLVTQPQPITQQPIGPLRDPAGDFSSKRLESFIAFVAAIVVIIVDVILGAVSISLKDVPVVELVGTLLAYSAAMQGVSAFSERNLFPQGLNTGAAAGLVGHLLTGGSVAGTTAGAPARTTTTGGGQ